MCGIVGHLGLEGSVRKVLEGLQRLEYRGYDSAGVCFKSKQGELQLFKRTGKLQNLINALIEVDKNNTHACIGHTRWATHGEVNDTNAHPHLSASIGIVHNGIIENAAELKEELVKKGVSFLSETDSEVFLALVVDSFAECKDLQQAVATAFAKIEGNSAFLVMDKDREEIIAIKRGAPLVCGSNSGRSEVFMSSDPYALIGLAETIYFPEDEVLCRLDIKTDPLIQFFELDGTPSKRYVIKEQEMSLDVAEKGEFEHYMLKEIHEQPELIRSLTQYYSNLGKIDFKHLQGISPKLIHIIACGTAWHAGLVIKNFIEKFNRIPCNVEQASEFRYRDPLLREGELGLFISQSGETADTLAAQELCQQAGLSTMSIVNVEGSTLYRNCDENLLIRAGVEIGVASTKAFTQQVLTGYIYSAALQKDSKPNFYVEGFMLLANRIEELLGDISLIKHIASEIYGKKGFIFTGRGKYFPIALEGALKLKEIAYVHAEGYASGELKHGPIALIDEEMVNIAIVGPELYDKTVSNIQEVKARRGIIVTIGPKGDLSLEKISDYYIGIDYSGLGDLAPIYTNVVNQLLSYYMAKFKGTDIDKPRNLAKSVTVE